MSAVDSTDYDWLNELRAQAVPSAIEPPALLAEPELKQPPRPTGELWAIRSLSGGAGRSSTALNLAFEAARLGKRVCLIDLDTDAPSLQVLLNVANAKTAVLAAIRLVAQERLDSGALEGLLLEIAARDASVQYLSSGPFTPGAIELQGLEVLLRVLTAKYDLVVADAAAGSGSELQRLLGRLADKQLLVVPAEPVSLGRLFASGFSGDLTGAAVLFNRVRSTVLGSNPNGQLTALAEKHGSFQVAGFLPLEQEIFDLAQQRGVPIRMINARAKTLPALAALLGTRTRALSARRHRG